MHAVSLTAELLSQIQSQRGRLHPFERLDMGHTAHIAVDLQNGFMEPGAPIEVPVARGVGPDVNLISASVRLCCGPRGPGGNSGASMRDCDPAATLRFGLLAVPCVPDSRGRTMT